MAKPELNIIEKVIYTRNGDTLYQVSDGNGGLVQIDAFMAGTGLLVQGDRINMNSEKKDATIVYEAGQ